jgi:hypothetical protein
VSHAVRRSIYADVIEPMHESQHSEIIVHGQSDEPRATLE